MLKASNILNLPSENESFNDLHGRCSKILTLYEINAFAKPQVI